MTFFSYARPSHDQRRKPVPPFLTYACDPSDYYEGHSEVLRLHREAGFYGSLVANVIAIAAREDDPTKVLGYVTADPVRDNVHDRDALHVNELCVDVPYRGQRTLGPVLLRTVIEQPAFHAIDYVELEPRPGSLSFYERLGFTWDMRDVLSAPTQVVLSAIAAQGH